MLGRLVVALVPLACFGQAGVSLGQGRWLSAAAALVVAWLRWRRHARARFAAYVLLSALAVRAAIAAEWLTVALAAAAVLLMQTAPARAAWPRLTPGLRRDAGDRMRRS